MHSLKADIDRWWSNLSSQLASLIEDQKIDHTITVGELIKRIDDRCDRCAVPMAYHEEKDCETVSRSES
jgi:hypothetical protein